jgi:hypothetical protein
MLSIAIAFNANLGVYRGAVIVILMDLPDCLS